MRESERKDEQGTECCSSEPADFLSLKVSGETVISKKVKRGRRTSEEVLRGQNTQLFPTTDYYHQDYYYWGCFFVVVSGEEQELLPRYLQAAGGCGSSG